MNLFLQPKFKYMNQKVVKLLPGEKKKNMSHKKLLRAKQRLKIPLSPLATFNQSGIINENFHYFFFFFHPFHAGGIRAFAREQVTIAQRRVPF